MADEAPATRSLRLALIQFAAVTLVGIEDSIFAHSAFSSLWVAFLFTATRLEYVLVGLLAWSRRPCNGTGALLCLGGISLLVAVLGNTGIPVPGLPPAREQTATPGRHRRTPRTLTVTALWRRPTGPSAPPFAKIPALASTRVLLKSTTTPVFAARGGDAVSIPRGAGHAFKITGTDRARWLVFSAPAGLERFFADAGEPLVEPVPPSEPPAPDRDRLLAAFAAHGLAPFAPGPAAQARADA